MGMFKYSSEVVPTQTLQLNTKTVCLYVFETHNLKLPSAEQEAILSSCKNNSSRLFSLPCWDEFDKLQSLFRQSLKYLHSLLPQPVIRTCNREVQEAERHVRGFPTPPCMPYPRSWSCGSLVVWKSLFLPQSSQTRAYILVDCFQTAGAGRTEKTVLFCGKGLVFWSAWGGKTGHTENSIFKHISWLWYLGFLHGFFDFSRLYFQGNNL